MPTAVYYSETEDTELYTNLLFTELVHERLVEQEGEEAVESDPNLGFLHLPNFTQNNAPLMKQLGRDLRLIADEFERSPERRRVLARAEAVHLEDISYDEFGAFLEELFTGDGGFSREQVVVMLFFCSDMVVKAYHNPLANFKRLFSWFLEFIMRKVCSWVKDHGGWGVVLGQHVPAFSKTIFYLTGTVVLTILLLKKIL